MANQTVTTAVNYDDASISGLLNGESITINGGSVTINSDVRWNQQAAVFDDITISSSLGGEIVFDGTTVWELPFDASTGNVPTQNALGSNGVTSSGGATGELLRVWGSASIEPLAAGGAMPATGWIKLRSKTGDFADNEVVTLPGGATITLTSAGKRSWIHIVALETGRVTVPSLGKFTANGDWYEVGQTNGTDNQTFQLPVADEFPAIQVETGSGTGVYEWWLNADYRWNDYVNIAANTQTVNVSRTNDIVAGPTGALPGGFFSHGARLRETTANNVHYITSNTASNAATAGLATFRTFIKKETRRYVAVQAFKQTTTPIVTTSYTVLIDLDTGTVSTTRTIGSPTGTSATITPLNNGWYVVDLTMDVVANDGLTINIAISNSATPTWTAGDLPTYTGATTEGVYFGELLIINASNKISTDERGKFFTNDHTTGVMQIAKRGTYDAGYKPPSGCKIRIPNIILSQARGLDYTLNTQPTSATNRAGFANATAGYPVIDKVLSNWHFEMTYLKGITLTNSAVAFEIRLTDIQGPIFIDNCAGNTSKYTNTTPLTLIRCFATVEVQNSRFNSIYNIGSGSTSIIQLINNAKFTNCSFETFGNVFVTPNYSNSFRTVTVIQAPGITFANCYFLGNTVNLTDSTNATFLNSKFAYSLFGITENNAYPYSFITVASQNGLTIDGFELFAGIPNICPFLSILSVSTTGAVSNLIIQNIGTPSSPLDAGTIVAMQFLLRTIGAGYITNCTIRRVYINNLTNLISFSNSNTINLNCINVWGDTGDSQVANSSNTLSQGCQWTNPVTTQSNIYGTHWEDAFTSTTTGRIVISCNEPTIISAAQCISTLNTSAGSGFTSNGSVSMKSLTDEIIWTMPYYALGITGFANTAPTITGTNANNHTFTFQYDLNDGNGYNGTWLALSAANLSAITVDPNDGVKLKVRATVNTAAATNLLNFIRINTVTNATDQQIQYPLPFDSAGVISNIDSGSRIQIYNVNTSIELYNGVVSGTSYTYEYYEGVAASIGDIIRVRITKLGSLPQELLAIVDASGFAATANALPDDIYIANGIDGSTVTEFIADYPNIQVDISDPDQITTVQRIYAFIRYVETEQNGIAEWFNAIKPTDDVNYLIDSSILDLKLDNTQATPVVIGGGRLYRSDDTTIIATLSGSIQMDPQRVYSGSGGGGATAAEIADTVLRRSTANVEASSTGDPISLKSLYGMIAQGVHNTQVTGATLTVTKSDDATVLGTRTVTTSADAQPITGIDSD